MYRNPLCHRYGIKPTIDPVTEQRAYETLDGSKVIWRAGRTSKGYRWRTFGADTGSTPWLAKTFDTLREAAVYATGNPIPKTKRGKNA